MKTTIFNSKYFIVLGLFIFLCFTGIGIFITRKFNQRTERIALEIATKIFQLKANVVHNEFNNLIAGLTTTEAVVAGVHSKKDFYRLKSTIGALLIKHPKIQNGWYAIAGIQDTIYGTWNTNGQASQQNVLPAYQLKWIKQQLKNKDTPGEKGAVVPDSDSLHWLTASKYRLADSSDLIFGLDINLKLLHQHLWGVDSIGRAIAFIIDVQGHYITNQRENLIGTKMPSSIKTVAGKKFLADSVSNYETVNSDYLQIPVIRYYTPLNVSPMKWTMVIDTPVISIDEDVRAIEDYVLLLFIFTGSVILLLIAWSQTKWQKEFMLRQQAEMKRQELSLEKQALSLIAERQQKENAILQLDRLKEKVNPHFLFNSLSSLNGLIQENPELAKSFVIKLSRVYRYVLDPTANGLEEVSKELRFATAYFFLLKIRFGDGLAALEVNISEEHLNGYIPFMSLQTLVENAVKHNVVSKSKPLHIRIQSDGNYIRVTNNHQLRDDVNISGKQGLDYLQGVYAHFGDYQLIHDAHHGNYDCSLPVIENPFTP